MYFKITMDSIEDLLLANSVSLSADNGKHNEKNMSGRKYIQPEHSVRPPSFLPG